MPQYAITYIDRHSGHQFGPYTRWGITPEEALDFKPEFSICLPGLASDDTQNITVIDRINLDIQLLEIKEVVIVTTFALADDETYYRVEAIAKERGLEAVKDTRAWCLEVTGAGDWMKEDWVKNYPIVTTNWLYDRALRYGYPCLPQNTKTSH